MKKAISILAITLVVSIALNIKLYIELTAAGEAKKSTSANANISAPKNITLPAKMKELRKLSKEEADCIGSPEVRQCTDAEWDAIVEKKAEKMKQICETEDHPNRKEACEYNKEEDKEYLKKRRQGLMERLQKKQERTGPNRHLK